MWETLAPMTLALAGGIQSAAMFAAFYYIEDTAAHKSDELKDIPNDEEVMESELKDQKRKISFIDLYPYIHIYIYIYIYR